MELIADEKYAKLNECLEFSPRDFAEDYDRLARIYDRLYTPMWPDAYNLEIVQNIINWPGGKNILEVGVGTGSIAGLIYLNGYHNITGVDFSVEMKVRMKEKCPKVDFIKQDITETEFHGYDWIVLVGNIIERIQFKQEFFQKLYDQADPGTYIFIDNTNNSEYPKPEPGKIRYSKESFGAYLIETNFVRETHEHEYGITRYTDKQTDDILYYRYALWHIIPKDLEALMAKVGFKLKDRSRIVTNMLFDEDFFVFQK